MTIDASASASSTALYVGVGPVLSQYVIRNGAIEPGAALDAGVPAPIQYVARHPSRPVLFVASSNRSTADDRHDVTAFAIAPGSGRLRMIGEPTPLPSRPIHISLDREGRFLLVAYNAPSGLTVHAIAEDGTAGAAIAQPLALDVPDYPHQIRMLPSNRTTVLCARGTDASATTAEQPGALALYDFEDGRLAPRRTIAPQGGFGFGPRHLDFHPDGRFAYVSVERGNRLETYAVEGDGLGEQPLFAAEMLAEPDHVRPGQVAGAIHVSRDGRFVYACNRNDGKVVRNGRTVFGGGENAILVFAIDPDSGEPSLIQRIDTRSYHARTFSLDPSGRWLAAASVAAIDVEIDGGVETVPATLTAFEIGPDGRLDLTATRALDTGAGPAFWCGFVEIG